MVLARSEKGSTDCLVKVSLGLFVVDYLKQETIFLYFSF